MGTETEILTMSIEELWNMFKKEVDLDSIEFNQVRNGVAITFDIIDFFQSFNVNVKEKNGIFLIGGKKILKSDVDTELILRERIMAKYLVEKYGNRRVASPRLGRSE